MPSFAGILLPSHTSWAPLGALSGLTVLLVWCACAGLLFLVRFRRAGRLPGRARDPGPHVVVPAPEGAGEGVGAEIVITRVVGYATNSLGAYSIWIDGQRVGRISEGDTVVCDVVPGEHEVQIKAGMSYRSRALRVNATPERQVYFRCEPAVSSWIAGWVALYKRRSWIKLTKVSAAG